MIVVNRISFLAVSLSLLIAGLVSASEANDNVVDGPSLRAAPECSSCVERKKPMCADECSDVKPLHQRECQLRCIKEYCKHRCVNDAPQYADFQTQSCEDCLNEQFVLCEKQCPAGTPRAVAECKIQCSVANCQVGCR